MDDNNKLYVGKDTFTFMNEIGSVKPYGFDVHNLTNSGFSFIDKDPSEMFYCENDKYVEIN
jgi:hypothetical protein